MGRAMTQPAAPGYVVQEAFLKGFSAPCVHSVGWKAKPGVRYLRYSSAVTDRPGA